MLSYVHSMGCLSHKIGYWHHRESDVQRQLVQVAAWLELRSKLSPEF